MNSQCPGQDKRDISAKTVSCSNCGYRVEIFSDEIKVKCPNCKRFVCQDRLPSCIDWCKAAAGCVGEDNYNKYLNERRLTLKDKLTKELEDYFGCDLKRINHAKKVLGFSEEILKREKADWQIVIPASILHDVGIKAAEAKFGSSSGKYQEKEGPAIAREILLKLGCRKADIEEICEIIAYHHSPGKINTLNFKVLYDADWLVNFKDEVYSQDKDKIKNLINKIFLTATGKEMAENIYLKNKVDY